MGPACLQVQGLPWMLPQVAGRHFLRAAFILIGRRVGSAKRPGRPNGNARVCPAKVDHSDPQIDPQSAPQRDPHFKSPIDPESDPQIDPQIDPQSDPQMYSQRDPRNLSPTLIPKLIQNSAGELIPKIGPTIDPDHFWDRFWGSHRRLNFGSIFGINVGDQFRGSRW